METEDDGSGKRGFKPKVDFGEKRPGARSFVVSPEGVFVHNDGALHTLADAVDLFWAGVARDPGAWAAARKGYDYLLEHAVDASREDRRFSRASRRAAARISGRPSTGWNWRSPDATARRRLPLRAISA